ncbi:MAG: hypothetical protein LBR52_02220 [Prevotellaceae bacterium]|jgi:hypothetical protein|nr:hypothetical protein [Prevotellaceae bacterium]
MEKLKLCVRELYNCNDKEQQIKTLQKINQLLLTGYMLEIDESFRVYPIEVEAYYYNENFRDLCVHRNELQENRFGKLYFHRAGKAKETAFLYDFGGIDICLSDKKEVFLGFLIRSAWINDEEKPVCGPGILTRRIVRHICKNDSIVKITENEKVKINQIEERNNTVVRALNDKRKKDSIVFNSTRFGINPAKYGLYKLRSLIELKEPHHPFKEKEKVIISYMKENHIKPVAENVKSLLGYASKSILEKLSAV